MDKTKPVGTTNKVTPVGIVGLGLLGSAIARRLLDAGYAVSGYDLDAAKGDALNAQGGRAASLAEIAASCERIIVAVFTPDQAREVIAALAQAAAGAPRVILGSTTCDADTSRALAAQTEAAGMVYIEAPISGASAQVLAGEGVGLIGGAVDVVAHAADLFAAICSSWFSVGPVGDAAKAKLAINLILGLNRLALAEGLAFAEQQGLDLKAFLEIARASACHSQVMDTKGEKMRTGDYSPQGRTVQTLKDVTLMLSVGERIGQPLPMAELHAQVLQACIAQGEGAVDSSVVIEELRRRRQPPANDN